MNSLVNEKERSNKVSEEEMVTFIKENQNQFYFMAYQYMKNKEKALDVVQESIYRAFKNYQMVREPQYLKTWFCRIIIHVSLDILKKEKNFIYNENIIEFCSGKEDEEYIDLYAAIDGLDMESKMIVTLRFFEDMKIEDVAQVMQLNVSTVKSKLYRALRVLKKELGGTKNEIGLGSSKGKISKCRNSRTIG